MGAAAQININSVLGMPNAAGAAAGGQTAVVTTEQVRAELVAWAPDGVGPGKQVWRNIYIIGCFKYRPPAFRHHLRPAPLDIADQCAQYGVMGMHR